MSNTLTGEATITVQAKATLSASYAGTNRVVRADETFGRVQEWAHGQSSALLKANALFAEVRDAIGLVKPAKTTELQLFRGRLPPFACGRPTREEMGPPPNGCAASGRYNGPGESALYLSSIPDGVRRELPFSEGQLWIQSFIVQTDNLRVADFSAPDISSRHLLNCVLWFAELAGAQGHPSIIFSQFIASIVSKTFDAMVVPGVRGDESIQYSNVVIFKPIGVWQQWLSLKHPVLL